MQPLRHQAHKPQIATVQPARNLQERSHLLCRYRLGPQPHDLGGQRALDFVLDNPTLQPFNRTLLIDISLLSVRKISR